MSNDYQQERLRLDEELKSLHADQALIAHRIGEIEERLTVLDEIEMASQEPACHTDSRAIGLWPEEAETIRASDKLVTRGSPLEDKYELFMKLFSGRPDVHAKRWRSGEAYSPDCVNFWKENICYRRKDVRAEVKCSECKYRVYAPLDFAIFKAHVNATNEGRKFVLGAYPLNADDNCKFIVADFDGKPKKTKANKFNAIEEVNDSAPQRARAMSAAFRATCLAADVPISVEISRSGKGYHVWLFFSDWVPGGKARRLFTALWTKTMNENPGLDFSVYDRFIPCQDTVSNSGLDGGIGNLVALPFQGEVGRSGFTVFLDAELKPYHDQWEYLSRIELMSPAALNGALQILCPASALGELLVDESDEEAVGARRPWDKHKIAVPLTKSDAESTVSITVANMVYINKNGLSARAQSRIKRLATFRNKEFYRKQNMRLSTYDEPRVISVAQENDEYLILPRGAEPAVVELLSRANIGFTIKDEHSTGIALDVTFTGKLKAEQTLAADAMLKHELGVLFAVPGFGKTVIGAYLIAARAVNTLVLVHRQDLYDQWKSELAKFLEIRNEVPYRTTESGRKKKQSAIGEYAGKKDWRSELVDVVMIQSLYNRGNLPDFIKDYGMVIIDEAHHATAGSF